MSFHRQTLESLPENENSPSTISITSNKFPPGRPSTISPVYLSNTKIKKSHFFEKTVPVSTNVLYLDVPMQVVCVYCGQIIYTKTGTKNSHCNWLVCSGIAFSGCFCGCCLIPFCVDIWKDIEHKCSNCDGILGVYRI